MNKSTDLHELLDTANLCFELWRSERGGLDSLKKKFEPLLRALVACLSPYPRVLDLRAAYPQLFG